MQEKKLTGYPSIDKPWLKYYSEEAINAPLPKCTMYQYIWENNKDHLSDIALRYYGTKITYDKLFENIKKAANAFYSMGVRAGDIVTIMSMHTPECIYALYGLNYIGEIANMVYMTLSEKEILDTLENTESKLLLVLDLVLDKIISNKDKIGIPVVVLGVSDSMPPYMKLGYRLKTKSGKHPFLSYSQLLSEGKKEPLLSDDHTAPAVIVYTSGTTGEPKGVELTNHSLNSMAFQDYTAEHLHIKRGYLFLDILPTFIGFGVAHIHLAIISGVESYLWIDLNPQKIIDQLFRINPNFFIAGPAFTDALINHKIEDLSNLNLFIGGGGAIADKDEKEINSLLRKCNSHAIYSNGYGMTEAASTLTCSSNEVYSHQSVGIPFPKNNVKIVDINSGKELKFNEIGELWFCTPNLMKGYFKNQKATDEIVSHDENGNLWLHTGDLGTVDENGFVYIKGRLKRIYITRGKDGTAYKLFPQRIEEAIKSNDKVIDCAALVKEDPIRMYVAFAYVTIKDNSNLDNEDLLKICVEELPEHNRPESIYIIDKMPITASGKIDYQALEKLVEEELKELQ